MSKQRSELERLVERRKKLGDEWIRVWDEEAEQAGLERRESLQKEIARLEAEIACHPDLPLLAAEQLERDAGRIGKETTSTKPAPWYESSLDVLRRRQIVLKNPNMADKSLCKLFDGQRIPVPEGWTKQTWSEAYQDSKLRQRIHKIISTDRSGGG